MATTVTNNTIQGRDFHWKDTGGIPQLTFINGLTTVTLASLTFTDATGGVHVYASAKLSAHDQAKIVENANLLTNWPLDFLVA
jgi:hypothetical protein